MSEPRPSGTVPALTFVLPGRWLAGAPIPEAFQARLADGADDPQAHVCVELESGESTPLLMLTMWPRIPVGRGLGADHGAADLAADLSAAGEGVEVVDGLNPEHGVLRQITREPDETGAEVLTVTYWLTRTTAHHVLLVAFLTPLAEIETEVVAFTDAIVRTFRWGDDAEADA